MHAFTDAQRPERMRVAKPDLTCKRCDADCYWQEVIDANGRPKVRLFEGGKPHVCKPSDDFDVVGS